MASRVRFAIVSAPDTKCEYCLMLSSRDAIYRSAETAEASKHTNCNCEVIPLAAGESMPGYDPTAIFAQWEGLRSLGSASGSSRTAASGRRAAKTTRAALDALRKSTGARSIEELQAWLDGAPTIKALRDRCAQIEKWSREIDAVDYGRLKSAAAKRKAALMANS